MEQKGDIPVQLHPHHKLINKRNNQQCFKTLSGKGGNCMWMFSSRLQCRKGEDIKVCEDSGALN